MVLLMTTVAQIIASRRNAHMMVLDSRLRGNDRPQRRARESVIMQNKANLARPRMNASLCGKKDYEKGPRRGLCKNKANQSQFRASEPVKSGPKKWVFSQRRAICLACSKTGNRVCITLGNCTTGYYNVIRSGSGGRPRRFAWQKRSSGGGKSEQDRARWWLTATGGDPRESATENTQPMAPAVLLRKNEATGAQATVKWRGKSAPRRR
jgi:hypothetical protein